MNMKEVTTKKFRNTARGQAMLFTMICVVILSTLVTYGISAPVVRDYKVASEGLYGRRSYFMSESSVEDILYRLKNSISVASSETLYDGTNYNTITVTDIGGGQKEVSAVSNVGGRQRTVVANVQTQAGTTTHLNYAVQSGMGGFVLSNNATINGHVYSNGNIVGANGATITGNAYAATSLPLTADQQNASPATPPSSLNFGNASATQDFAQSFQMSTQERLNKVRFYIKRTSSAPANLTVRITGNSSGKPSTTTIASTTVTATSVSTSYGWIEAVFSSNPILDTDTTYWLVLDTTANSTKYYTIGTNTGTYNTGTASLGTYGGTSWTGQSSDGYFSIWTGGINSSISSTTITGTTNAYSVSGSTVSGTLYCQTGSGNNKSCNTSQSPPSPVALPISTAQIDAWKAEALAGGTTNGTLTIPASQSLGPRKIVGDLNVDNGKILTVTGTLWVTGNITLSNNAIVRLASSYGTSSGVIIADGTINLSNNSVFQGSGSSTSYVLSISTSNGTGFNISNNAGAVVVYVPYGTIYVSNNGGASQLTGETIQLSNNATISYNANIANLSVSSGSGGGAWSIATWKETE
jgi:hypothetical protein